MNSSRSEPQKESYEPPRLVLLGSLQKQTRAGVVGYFDLSTFDS
ncbi:lasso RiPP family leader peptide-containing protein [Pigmentiphaga humi]